MRINLTNFIVRVISNNLKLYGFYSTVLYDCSWGSSRHLLNQSTAKLKPVAMGLFAFSRALGWWRVYALSPWWLLVVFSFVLIDCCYDLNCGFMAVIANGAQKYTFYLTDFFTNNAFMEMIQLFVERKMNGIERSTFVVYASAHSLLFGGGGGGKNRTLMGKQSRAWSTQVITGIPVVAQSAFVFLSSFFFFPLPQNGKIAQ